VGTGGVRSRVVKPDTAHHEKAVRAVNTRTVHRHQLFCLSYPRFHRQPSKGDRVLGLELLGVARENRLLSLLFIWSVSFV
jgi:hypothetical protein